MTFHQYVKSRASALQLAWNISVVPTVEVSAEICSGLGHEVGTIPLNIFNREVR